MKLKIAVGEETRLERKVDGYIGKCIDANDSGTEYVAQSDIIHYR